MHIAVEISLYPLDQNYIPKIQDFIDRLNRYQGLKVTTNRLSTQVFGEHARIFDALREEMAATFAAGGKAVFVTKVVGPYPLPDD